MHIPRVGEAGKRRRAQRQGSLTARVASIKALSGDHFAIYTDIESLSCTLETNITLCGNYIPLKKIKERNFRGTYRGPRRVLL